MRVARLGFLAFACMGVWVVASCVGDAPDPAIAPPDSGRPDPTVDSGEDSGQADAPSESVDAGDASAPRVVHIAAALDTTCALYDDGRVKCWGSNNYGTVGNGRMESHVPLPTEVTGLDDAVAIGTGGFHVCVATRAGGVKCWGDNFYGASGDGTFHVDGGQHRPTPTPVPGITNANRIASGHAYMSCAITNATPPTAKCWGLNEGYNTGAASTEKCVGPLAASALGCQPSPVDVQGGTATSTIGKGTAFTCIGHTGNPIQCWGLHAGGRLGRGVNGAGEIVDLPGPIHENLQADELSSGTTHTCARNGTEVRCWGSNSYGEVGSGQPSTGAIVNAPAAVTLPAPGTAKQIAVRGYTSCALLTNGTVACWGAGGNKQLGGRQDLVADCNNNAGGGAQACTAVPALVPGVTDAIEIAVGFRHVCALLEDGRVQCWGSNERGQCGNGAVGGNVEVPVDAKL